MRIVSTGHQFHEAESPLILGLEANGHIGPGLGIKHLAQNLQQPTKLLGYFEEMEYFSPKILEP
jgi:hypothetical protein